MKTIKIIATVTAIALTTYSTAFQKTPITSMNEHGLKSVAEDRFAIGMEASAVNTLPVLTTSTTLTSATSTTTKAETTSTSTSTTTTTTSTTTTETTTTTTTEPVTEPAPTETTSIEATYPVCEEERIEGDNSYWANPSKYVLDYSGLTYSYTADEDYLYFDNITISRRDYILLCNCVANEYGCADYVPTYERSLVCEVLFNRLNAGCASDLYGVVTAQNQFTGCGKYADAETFVGVAESSQVQDAVCMYLDNCDSDTYYQEGYMFFNGDNVWNYFRISY